MRIALFAAAIACLTTGSLGQGVAVTPDFSRLRTAADVDVVGLMSERYAKTLALLEREFPRDHATLMDALAEIDRRAASEETLLLAAAREFTELRRRYADRLRFAPTVSHAAMLGHLAAFYDLVFKTEGPEVCGRFAQDGSAALFEAGLSATYAKAIDDQSVSYFEAVVKAIEIPEPSEAVTPEDWEVIMSRMIEAGAPVSFAATIGRGDPSDPNLCPALAALFVTITVLDTPEGARARADFARNLSGY